jgi:hypothetical protein
MHITNSDKPVEFYSLDVIISIGYRVKSLRGEKTGEEEMMTITCHFEQSEKSLFRPTGGILLQRSLGKVHQLFGDKLNIIIEELNETLAA